jgi:hypothetical protein
MGLDFERDNAAVPEHRGEPSPELAETVSAHVAMEGVTAEAFGGAVLLAGVVADRYQKERAESLAREVEGVTDVENRIRVQKPEPGSPVLTTRDPGSADEPTTPRS